MTDEQIKELLSQRFMETIASRNGFKCSKPEPDSGVDLSITRSRIREQNGRKRFLDTGEYVEFQLKATCEGNVIQKTDGFKYDLEAKTFNDLVDRQSSGALTPLFLIVFLLPDDATTWLTVNQNELILRRAAYWFMPPQGSQCTTNTGTIRIDIPYAQVVDLSFIETKFSEVYG